MVHQETEGLLSPLIRDIRLRKVASHIKSGSAVLDIACGNGYLGKFLPEGCEYYGVDRVLTTEENVFTEFLALDLLEEDAFKKIQEWLPCKPDYITCIAFLEHVDDPKGFVQRSDQLLSSGGSFIGTTPHPRGRGVHDFLAKMFLCSRHGAEEHKDFLGRKEIVDMAVAANGELLTYSQFLFGLNQLFVIEYPQQ